MPSTIHPYLLHSFSDYLKETPNALGRDEIYFSWKPTSVGAIVKVYSGRMSTGSPSAGHAGEFIVFGVVTKPDRSNVIFLGRPEWQTDGATGMKIALAYDKQLVNLAIALEDRNLEAEFCEWFAMHITDAGLIYTVLGGHEIIFFTDTEACVPIGAVLFATVTSEILSEPQRGMDDLYRLRTVSFEVAYVPLLLPPYGLGLIYIRTRSPWQSTIRGRNEHVQPVGRLRISVKFSILRAGADRMSPAGLFIGFTDDADYFSATALNPTDRTIYDGVCAQCDKSGAPHPNESPVMQWGKKPYLEAPGDVYVLMERDDLVVKAIPTLPQNQLVNYLNLKVGKTKDIDLRREGHAGQCIGVEKIWAYQYHMNCPLLLAMALKCGGTTGPFGSTELRCSLRVPSMYQMFG
ncbi:hypothetical protein DFH09DRAFT_1073049 [Mycena vulgaris]|nr:hypothetical protein DFH09DRAFT_1073049 [Mycena vulgaris]